MPDVVLIGEMRDLETDRIGATHRGNGPLGRLQRCTRTRRLRRSTVFIDVFPAHQQPQVRAQLSMCWKAFFVKRVAAVGRFADQREW